jgi:hypothetical protein
MRILNCFSVSAEGREQQIAFPNGKEANLGNKNIDYEGLDPSIRPLVELLNDIDNIETYISCEGHNGECVWSRTPYVCFWLKRTLTEDGHFLFSNNALDQLARLVWVVNHTYEEGFVETRNCEDRYRTPLARIVVARADPRVSDDELPEQWSPVAFCLEVLDKSRLPLLVETLRKSLRRIRGR